MRFRLPALALLALLMANTAHAQPFTYQGFLKNGGSPANGLFNLDFDLFDAASAGTQIGATITQTNVNVAQGLSRTVARVCQASPYLSAPPCGTIFRSTCCAGTIWMRALR